MADGGSLETQLLAAIGAQGQLADSGEFAAGANVDHLVVVGLLKSLQAADMITMEVRASEEGPAACTPAAAAAAMKCSRLASCISRPCIAPHLDQPRRTSSTSATS